MTIRGTLGQVLINDALPKEMRDYSRVLDKKGMTNLLREVAQKHPDKYRDVSFRLQQVGGDSAQESGGMSFGLQHMRRSRAATETRQRIRTEMSRVLKQVDLSDEQRRDLIVLAASKEMKPQQEAIFKEALAEGNPLALQVLSGSRGNQMNLASLLGSDLLYSDHRDRPIPIPVLHSYSEGLTPAEYWAGAYGARKGVTSAKFATQDAGFLCLSGDTLVRMADWSVKAIRYIKIGDKVLGANKQGDTFPIAVTATFVSGVKELFAFRFRYGKSRTRFIVVKATKNHKALAECAYSRRSNPKSVQTVDVGIYPLGDFERRSVSWYALLPPQGFQSDAGDSKPLAEWSGKLAQEKHIPVEVDSWDNQSVKELLRWLFMGDGGIADNNNTTSPIVTLGMTALPVVDKAAELLANRFGIYGQLHTAEPQENGKYLERHLTISDRESVVKLAELIGTAWGDKHERLLALLEDTDPADRQDKFLFHYMDCKELGPGGTFDIEVDHPDHLFVLANGAIVSNSKQLNQVSHRLVVEDEDYADEDEQHKNVIRGLPVDTDDMDNEGALLAKDIGPYTRNTHLTPKILKHIKRLGHNRILVRSPMIGGTPAGGIYARDAGVRETGRLSGRGEMIGLQAAQALSEPLAQAQMSAKHSGGVAGEEKGVSGFEYINQLVQVPKSFKGGAAHATLDGTVQRIEPAPAGGNYVTINDEQHYVGKDYKLKVSKGDTIEAGDVLSEGIPNPAKIVKYKGIGEGRNYFVNTMREAMNEAGLKSNRRNIEILSRGLINHARITEEYGDNVPDDVVPYSTLEHTWKPREGHQIVEPRHAIGKYLERPVMHYTIGTKIRPSMLKDMQEFGINNLTVHANPPPFEPEMIRGMYSLQHDPDWMTRFYGSGLKKSLLNSVHRGGTSDDRGTSFIPSLSKSVDFGNIPGGAIRQPDLGSLPDASPIQPSEEADQQKTVTPLAPLPKMTSFFGGKFSVGGLSSSTIMPKVVTASDQLTIGEFIKQAEGESSLDVGSPAGGGGGGGVGNISKPIKPIGSGNPWLQNPIKQQKSLNTPQLDKSRNFSLGYKPSQGVMTNPATRHMAPHMINMFEQGMPGIGGVLGMGYALDPNAMQTLMGKGQQSQSQRQQGAAGYGQNQHQGAAGYGQNQTHQPTGTGQVPGQQGQQGQTPESLLHSTGAWKVPGFGKDGWLGKRLPSWQNFMTGQDATGASRLGPIGNAINRVPLLREQFGFGAPTATTAVDTIKTMQSELAVAQQTNNTEEIAKLTKAIATAESAKSIQTMQSELTVARQANNADKVAKLTKAIADAKKLHIANLSGWRKPVAQVANLPGVAPTGRALSHLGRWLGPAGYVLDAGLTGYGVSTEGFDGYADRTGDEYRDMLTGKHGLWTPLSAMGTIFSPARNAQIAASGLKQTGETINEVNESMAQAQRVGHQEQQQYQSGANPHMTNPVGTGSDVDRKLRELHEQNAGNPLKNFINPTKTVGALTDTTLAFLQHKGQHRAVREHAVEMTDQAFKAYSNRPYVQYLQRLENEWQQAGRPTTSEWAKQYTQGQRDDYQDWLQRANMSPESQKLREQSTGELLTEDLASRSVGLPGYEDVVIPGTGAGVKRLASLNNLWHGNYDINPFYTRGKRQPSPKVMDEATKVQMSQTQQQATQDQTQRAIRLKEQLVTLNPDQRKRWETLNQKYQADIHSAPPTHSQNPKHQFEQQRRDLVAQGHIPGETYPDPEFGGGFSLSGAGNQPMLGGFNGLKGQQPQVNPKDMQALMQFLQNSGK